MDPVPNNRARILGGGGGTAPCSPAGVGRGSCWGRWVRSSASPSEKGSWLLPGKGTESDKQGERDDVQSGGKGFGRADARLYPSSFKNRRNLAVTLFTSVLLFLRRLRSNLSSFCTRRRLVFLKASSWWEFASTALSVRAVPFPTVGWTPVAYWKILLLTGFVLHLKYTLARICLNKVFAVLTLPPCSCQESCKTALIQCFMCSLAKE